MSIFSALNLIYIIFGLSYRRKKEKGREIVSGVRGTLKGKVGVSSLNSSSSGPLSHSQSTVASTQGPQHHTTGSVSVACDAQSQDPHQESVMSSVQHRPGMNFVCFTETEF